MTANSSRLGCDSLDHYELIRQTLNNAGYDEDTVKNKTSSSGLTSVEPQEFAKWNWLTGDGSALSTLIQLFILGNSVESTQFRNLNSPLELKDWQQIGILECDGENVSPLIRILPLDGFWVASDLPKALFERRVDFVMGVAPSTLTLARSIIQSPAHNVLDLGAGCGYQALRAGRFAQAVTATDLNQRAVDFSRFNADLNQCLHFKTLTGDLFEPVHGSKFDRIICNPPFVISPDTHFIFEHDKLRGDEMCRRIVREAADHLTTDGFCQMNFDVGHLDNDKWFEQFAEWFEGLGCDVLAWVTESHPVANYALEMIQDIGNAEVKMDEALERWMKYYAEQEIERISLGVLTMRKSASTQNWIRIDTISKDIHSNAGDLIERIFAFRDLINSSDGHDVLMNSRLVACPGIEFAQTHVPADDGWGMSGASIKLNKPISSLIPLPPKASWLVTRCQSKSVREAIQELADASQTTFESSAEEIIPIIQSLIEQGCFKVAD